MNNVFTFVFLIVTVTLCARLLQTYLEQRNNQPELNNDVEETLAKIVVLEERIEVLERIITEQPYDLKKEIDSL